MKIWIIFAMALLLVIVVGIDRDDEQKIITATPTDAALAQAKSEYEAEIAQAEKDTADPCKGHPMRLVENRLAKETVFVFAGHVIPPSQIPELDLQAVEPASGEKVIRVVMLEPFSDELSEIAFLAAGTRACKAGLNDEIKNYAIFGPYSGMRRSPWPTPKEKK